MTQNLIKNDTVETEIDDIGYEGEGIAHVDGLPVFIKGALPGEKVRAKIILVKKSFAVGIVTAVLKKSPHRILPQCRVYGKCGGCSLSHASYETQLVYKAEALKKTLQKQLGTAPLIEKTVPSPSEFHYRNKLSLPVRRNESNSEPEFGFFASKSHRIVPTDDCLLQNFDIKRLIEIVKAYLIQNKLIAYSEITRDGTIRNILVRNICKKLFITLVVNSGAEKFKELDNAFKNEYGENYAYYINVNKSDTNAVLGDEFLFIGGSGGASLIDGLKMNIHPAAFFQVNDSIRELLYSAAKDELYKNVGSNEKKYIIDAYAGAALLSCLLVSVNTEKVYSLEENENAHNSARELVKENGIEKVECVKGDCAVTLKSTVERILKTDAQAKIRVVLDPPRSGISENVTAALNDCHAVERVVYISCSPATLARDLALLSKNYEIERITPYDMFPQTPNLETLTVLSRKPKV